MPPQASGSLQIALLTSQEFFGHPLTAEDQLLQESLNHMGHVCTRQIWDSPHVSWQDFDLLVFRSTWDYHQKLEQFLKWMRERQKENLRFLNPLEAIQWNLNKIYLQELAAKGVPIPDTEWIDSRQSSRPFSPPLLTDIFKKHGWNKAVIKPLISAGGANTYALNSDECQAYQGKLLSLLQQGPVMMQEFAEEIVSEGEYSFIFFGGRFHHAILKKPRSGDFRVQELHGGTSQLANVPAHWQTQAEKILQAVPFSLAYAGIDAFIRQDRPYLMELEIFEPSLFLRQSPGAVNQLAEAIIASMDL